MNATEPIAHAEPQNPSNGGDEKNDIEEVEDNVKGQMSLEEELDLNALRKMRDNWDKVWERLGQCFWILDDKDKEYKPVDKKTAHTIISQLYDLKVETNKVSYRFGRNLKSGRRYADKNTLQGMNRHIRHTLCKNIYYDVDMKNAQPTFLLALCKKLNFSHPILEAYCANRDEYLQKWVGTELSDKSVLKDKDEAKKYFLRITNGGANDQSSSTDLNAYYNRHKELLDIVYKHTDYRIFRKRADNKNKEKKAQFEKDKKAGRIPQDKEFWDNSKGTCLNYYMAHVENIALTHIEIALQQWGIKYGVLCFDGIMVYKSAINDLHLILKNLETYLLEKMGFVIQLSSKEMNEGIDVSDLSEAEEVKTTDEDLALYLLEQIKDSYLYHQNRGEIWFYNEEEALWRKQKARHLRTYITKILNPYIAQHPDPKERDALLNAIKSDGKQSSIVRTCEPYIEKRRDDEFIQSHFDRSKGIFPLADRLVVDLKTGVVRPRTKTDYFTKTTTRRIVHLTPEDRSYILGYYETVLTKKKTDEELEEEEKWSDERKRTVQEALIKHRDCLISVMAYVMTGENHLKKFINFIGEADGGKSCFLEHHQNILGEFACQANKRLFVAQKNEACHDSEMFNLLGKRLASLTETKDDQKFNEDLIKKISGKDKVNIRGAGQLDTIDVLFDTVLLLATNNICQFADPAFMSRLLCFNFCNVFAKDATVPEKLRQNQDAFFTVLCEYAKKFYDNGMTFPISEQARSYTKEVCEKQDTIREWLREEGTYVKGTEDDYCDKPLVYQDYLNYWRGQGRKLVGKIKFFQQFQEIMGIEEAKKMTKHNRNFTGYSGVRRTIDEEVANGFTL
jgi:phage/plasmid-associated DNA primase